MTEKTPKLERHSIRRLIQQAKARTARPAASPTINALQNEIRRAADELERMLLAERMAK